MRILGGDTVAGDAREAEGGSVWVGRLPVWEALPLPGSASPLRSLRQAQGKLWLPGGHLIWEGAREVRQARIGSCSSQPKNPRPTCACGKVQAIKFI